MAPVAVSRALARISTVLRTRVVAVESASPSEIAPPPSVEELERALPIAFVRTVIEAAVSLVSAPDAPPTTTSTSGFDSAVALPFRTSMAAPPSPVEEASTSRLPDVVPLTLAPAPTRRCVPEDASVRSTTNFGAPLPPLVRLRCSTLKRCGPPVRPPLSSPIGPPPNLLASWNEVPGTTPVTR
jgi:hypothetical protein